MVAIEIVVTMATERVINISQYKVAAVSYIFMISQLFYGLEYKANIWYEDVSSLKQSVPQVVSGETLVTIATRQGF